MRSMSALEATGDIIAAGTALSGLMLVYVGAQLANFDSYTASEKSSVKKKFQVRIGLSGIGSIIGLLAALFALFAKINASENLAMTSVSLAVIAFLWAIFVMAANMWEVR